MHTALPGSFRHPSSVIDRDRLGLAHESLEVLIAFAVDSLRDISSSCEHNSELGNELMLFAEPLGKGASYSDGFVSTVCVENDIQRGGHKYCQNIKDIEAGETQNKFAIQDMGTDAREGMELRIRTLNKKLNQIRQLEHRRDLGLLVIDEAQRKKMASKQVKITSSNKTFLT